MNKILFVLIIFLLQGCGNNDTTQNRIAGTSIVNSTKINKTLDDLQRSLNTLYASCPGFNLYKNIINLWKFVGEHPPYPFMEMDYGWSGTVTEFHTQIPYDSTIPNDFRAFGHTCQYSVANNGEVDIMKTPCASVCLGVLVPDQDHNHLIISGKNVIKW